MKTDRPVVYVTSDALLVPSSEPDHLLDAGIAPYGPAFMTWCCSVYNTVLLTDLPMAYVRRLLHALKIDKMNIVVKPFSTSKVSALNPRENYYLIDDALIPSEVSWFLEHGFQDRLIGVDPHTGVSPATRQTLEARTRHGK